MGLRDSYIHVAHTEIHSLGYQYPVLQLQLQDELGINVNDLVSHLSKLSAPCPANTSLWEKS